MARNIEHVVTALGRAVIAKCLALGIPVVFTRAAIGTGTAPDAADISTYTALLNRYDDAAVADRSYYNATLAIAIQYLNTNTISVVNIGELGLYATDPDNGEVLFSYTTFGQYTDKLLPNSQTPILKTYEVAVDFSNGASVSVTINPSALLPSTDAVATPASGKLLRMNGAGKLPASITGDAATVGGNAPSAFALAGHTHGVATSSANGFMSKEDKASFDTMKDRVDQDLRTTAKPTFEEITADVIHRARFEV